MPQGRLDKAEKPRVFASALAFTNEVTTFAPTVGCRPNASDFLFCISRAKAQPALNSPGPVNFLASQRAPPSGDMKFAALISPLGYLQSSSDMTSRTNPPRGSPSPNDPSLESRPAPRKRVFPVRSFGPGATPDIGQRITSYRDIDRAAGTTDDPEDLIAEDHRDLLKAIEKWQNVSWRDDDRPVEPDPTWGYFLFLTDYTQAVRDAVTQALDNLVKVQQRRLGADTTASDAYAKEAYQRLKFSVIEDRAALEDASADRVRECFRTHVRGLEISDNEEDYPPPALNNVCLMLDSTEIEMLANLTFSDDRLEEARVFRERKLPAVDIWWTRPATTRSTYRGVRDLAINSLARVYDVLQFQNLERVEQWVHLPCGAHIIRYSFAFEVAFFLWCPMALHPSLKIFCNPIGRPGILSSPPVSEHGLQSGRLMTRSVLWSISFCMSDLVVFSRFCSTSQAPQSISDL